MTINSPVRLLILEASQNRAEELIVLLRNAGRATRAHLLASAADLNEKLNEQSWDLCLASQEVDGLTIEQVISQIKNLDKDIPIIMLATDRDPASITAGLKLGAVDVALANDEARLLLLIDRELGNLDNRRARRAAEVGLRETERRNQLLLDSSNTAIAYVHEGMHIYTNTAYGELFGYEDPDDFAGIPVIDLVAAEDQEKFKKFLRDFTSHPNQTEEFSCIASDESRIIASLSLLRLLHDPEVRLERLEPGRIFLLRFVVGDRPGNDYVATRLPVRGRGDLVRGRQLHRIKHAQDFGEVAARRHRIREHQLDLFVRSDDKHRANRVVGRRGTPFGGVTRIGRQHAEQLGHLEVGVPNHREVHLVALCLLDVLGPLLVLVDGVHAETENFAAAPGEFRLEARHRSEFGRADRCEVFRVGKENRPRVSDPFVKTNRSLRRHGFKIRHRVINSQHDLFLACGQSRAQRQLRVQRRRHRPIAGPPRSSRSA